MRDNELEYSKKWLYIHGETLPGSDRTVLNKDNDYLIDRQHQKTGNYTGIRGFGMQDCGIQESMGPISDRTREHLGSSDQQIIKLRQYMLRALSTSQTGGTVPGLDARAYKVRSGSFTVANGLGFQDGLDACIRT